MNFDYKVTNENLYCIERGLSPKLGDNIYSVCASGDVPFMLILNDAKVFAADYKKSQIEHVQKRINFLQNDDNEGFSSWSMNDCNFSEESPFYSNFVLRDDFFSRMDYGKMKNNLDNLKFGFEDVLNVERDFSKFNKIYLSNIGDYYLRDHSRNSFLFKINLFSSKLNPNTLVYITSAKGFDSTSNFEFLEKNKDLSDKLSKEDSAWDVGVFLKKN